MLKAIKNIVLSERAPIDKTLGWLKPIKGKVLEMWFFLNGAWRPVSDAAASELGEVYLTSIKTNVEDPLIINVEVENGIAVISGGIEASSASANGYMSSTQYTQLANLVSDPLQYAEAITVAEIDALFD